MICPGFIDMHSHSDLVVLLSRPSDTRSSCRQGVTTELMGMDGLSYAPCIARRDWSNCCTIWRP